MTSTKKSRKKAIEQLTKQAEQEATIKKVAQEAAEITSDAEEFSDKVFQMLLDNIKIEGLED